MRYNCPTDMGYQVGNVMQNGLGMIYIFVQADLKIVYVQNFPAHATLVLRRLLPFRSAFVQQLMNFFSQQ